MLNTKLSYFLRKTQRVMFHLNLRRGIYTHVWNIINFISMYAADPVPRIFISKISFLSQIRDPKNKSVILINSFYLK